MSRSMAQKIFKYLVNLTEVERNKAANDIQNSVLTIN